MDRGAWQATVLVARVGHNLLTKPSPPLEKGIKTLTLIVCFLLLKRETKKCLTLAAYFFHLETPSPPACYPLTPTPQLLNLSSLEPTSYN